MNLTQYYFDPEVTKEDKKTLKKDTFQTEVNIGIYVSVDKNKSVSNSSVFNDVKIFFNITAQVIYISQHLLSIMQFLMNRASGKDECYVLSFPRFNPVCGVIDLDIKFYIKSFKSGETYKLCNVVIYLDNKYDKQIYVTQIKEHNSKIIKGNKCNLTNEYNDFIKSQKERSLELINNKEASETLSGKKLNSIQIIMFDESDTFHEVNFKNCKNFNEISEYFCETLGIYGDFKHEIDLKTENEIITCESHVYNLLDDETNSINILVNLNSRQCYVDFTNCRYLIQISKYMKKRFGTGWFKHKVDLEAKSIYDIEYIVE